MAKSKKVTLEKKAKAAPEFDQIKPEQRVKSIKDGKVSKKKPKVKKEVLKSNAAEIIKNDPTVKKNLKEKKALVKPKDDTETAEKSLKRDVVTMALINLRKGIKKEGENNSKIAKNLFDDELRYGLNIVGVKIPVCPPHTRKVLLKHSLYDTNPDVCFFISDAIPKKKDQDETVRLFKEKLEAAGITNVTNVMTLTQLKRDYSIHSSKLKLCHTYDVFLVESKIAEHVYSVLGKHFITKRKRPFQVDTKNDKLMKISIENAIKKSTMKISPKSLISTFEVGTAKMDNTHIADNIIASFEQLKEKWPGGLKNIGKIYVKPMQPSKICIPIYASAVNPNDVEVPVIAGAKQNRLEKLQAKLKKKGGKLNLNVKAKKIALNKVVVAKKVDEEEAVPEKPNKRKHDDESLPAKKKKKEKPTEVIETPPAPEPEKKKKKKVEAVQEVVVEDPAKKKKSKDKVIAEEVIPEISEKKKKKSKSSGVEEIKPDPPKAKNKKSVAVTEETNVPAEKDQAIGKKKKAKKNKM